MSSHETLPGFHLGLCGVPSGALVAPAGEGCAENCPRRLRAEVERLRDVIADMECRCGPYPELDKAWCQRCAALRTDL